MNTAIVGTDRAPASPITLIGRMSRRIGAFFASTAGAPGRRRVLSRDELAELHERRQVADRLREERFGAVAVGRLL